MWVFAEGVAGFVGMSAVPVHALPEARLPPFLVKFLQHLTNAQVFFKGLPWELKSYCCSLTIFWYPELPLNGNKQRDVICASSKLMYPLICAASYKLYGELLQHILNL